MKKGKRNYFLYLLILILLFIFFIFSQKEIFNWNKSKNELNWKVITKQNLKRNSKIDYNYSIAY